MNWWSWDKLPLFFLILYLWVKLLLYVYNFTLCLKFCSYWFFRHHFVIVSCCCIKCTGNKNELWWRWHFVLDQWWAKQEWRSFLFWWSQKHWRSILPWAKLMSAFFFASIGCDGFDLDHQAKLARASEQWSVF